MPFANPLHDPSLRLIRFPLPQARSNWPKAPSQFVFIFEAINLVGSAIFGAEWTGEELASINWIESPKAQLARARQYQKPVKPIPNSLSEPRRRQVTYAPIEHLKDWRAQMLHVDWEQNRRAVKRLFECVDWIAQRCRDGELTAFWRLQTGGGPILPMRADEWNIDNPFSTFVASGGNKRLCRELKYGGPFEIFVFFEKRELQEVLKHQPEVPLIVGETDLSRLSPYLRLAVWVALEQGYSSEGDTPKLAERSYQVRRRWDEYLPGVPFSESAANQLARFIGFPDAQAIANGQRGGRGKRKADTQKP